MHFEDYVNISMSIADELLLAEQSPVGDSISNGQIKNGIYSKRFVNPGRLLITEHFKGSPFLRKRGGIAFGVQTPRRTPYRVNSYIQSNDTDSDIDIGTSPTAVLFRLSPTNEVSTANRSNEFTLRSSGSNSPTSTGYETDLSDSHSPHSPKSEGESAANKSQNNSPTSTGYETDSSDSHSPKSECVSSKGESPANRSLNNSPTSTGYETDLSDSHTPKTVDLCVSPDGVSLQNRSRNNSPTSIDYETDFSEMNTPNSIDLCVSLDGISPMNGFSRKDSSICIDYDTDLSRRNSLEGITIETGTMISELNKIEVSPRKVSPKLMMYGRSVDCGYSSVSSDTEAPESPKLEQVRRYVYDNDIFSEEYTPPGGQANKRRKCMANSVEGNQIVPQTIECEKVLDTGVKLDNALIRKQALDHINKPIISIKEESDITHCPTHNHYHTNAFCKACSDFICAICRLNLHAGHNIIDLNLNSESAFTNLRKELTESLSGAQKNRNMTESCLKNLHKQKCMLIGRIQDRRDYLHDQVEIWYRKMETQLDTACADEETRLNELLNNMEQTIQDTGKIQRRVEELMFNLKDKMRSLSKGDTIELDEIKSVIGDHNGNDVKTLNNGLLMNQSENVIPETLCTPKKTMKPKEPSTPKKLIAMSLGNAIQFDAFGSLAVTEIPESECAISSEIPSKIPVVSRVKHLRTFETRPTDSDLAYMATGITVGNENNVIVSDIGMDTVKEFSDKGQLKVTFNTMPEDYPTKAVALQNGQVVVSCENGVNLFHANGELKAKNIGDLECPGMLAVSNNDVVVIESHSDSHSVTTINSETREVKSRFCSKLPEDVELYSHSWFTSNRELESEKSDTCEEVEHLRQVHAGKYRLFYKPWYVAVNARSGDVIISDREDHTIKVFTREGELRWSVGGQGMGVGEMFNPAGVVVDRYNNVIVADNGNDRVQLFSDKGECLGVIATRGHDDIESPTDVALDRDGYLYVLQADGKVSRFQYLF